LKLKIIVFAIFSILIVIFLVNYISNNFKEITVEVKEQHLLSVAYSTSSHLKTYFKELENIIYSLANSSKTSEALYSFRNSFNEIKNTKKDSTKYLQNNYYDTSNLSYSRYYKKFHNYFDKEKQIHGLYDIFLIDTTGNIIYTVEKESDFGTNLHNGSYSNTNLAKAFKKAIKLKSSTDFLQNLR
jgi:methyl-accepting chemotaxis protein